MRTGYFLVAGLLLMAASLILGKLFTAEFPNARQWAVGIGIGVWLILTGFNMWVGVAKAGYSIREEVPVLLLLFGIPTIVVLFARRWVP
ncbi:MAG: hypothetical protein KF785_13640 [Gemmatimonadales bacterium]|nr:hypothetical protein [Gemmatimonadales bacterium]